MAASDPGVKLLKDPTAYAKYALQYAVDAANSNLWGNVYGAARGGVCPSGDDL